MIMKKFPNFNHYMYQYTPEQVKDISIVLNLNTREEMQEWIRAVGDDDVIYGIALLESVALDMLNDETADMRFFPEAESVINRIRARGA